MDKTEDLRYLKSNLRYLTGIAKKAGYRQVESVNIKHVRNIEELLETERKERKALQEERTRLGEEVKKLVRGEMEWVGNC